MYIGQAYNIEIRLKNHLSNLRKNDHDNDHLQKSWNKYSEENFKFFILEECSKKELDDKEKEYIKINKSIEREFGYNKCEGGSWGKLSEDSLRKISETISHKKLSNCQAQEVIDKLIDGCSVRDLAVEYNVKEYIIKAIKYNESYRFIDRKGYFPEKNKKRSKLTDEEVINILTDINNGEKICLILKKYSIGRKLLNKIRNNENFQHINRDKFINTSVRKRKIYNNLNEELAIKTLELLSSGKKITQVSDIMNISYEDVKKLKDNLIFKDVNRDAFNLPKIARKNCNFRFSDEEVKKIIELLKIGKSIKDICKIYGKENANIISKIKHGYLYKHISRI